MFSWVKPTTTFFKAVPFIFIIQWLALSSHLLGGLYHPKLRFAILIAMVIWKEISLFSRHITSSWEWELGTVASWDSLPLWLNSWPQVICTQVRIFGHGSGMPQHRSKGTGHSKKGQDGQHEGTEMASRTRVMCSSWETYITSTTQSFAVLLSSPTAQVMQWNTPPLKKQWNPHDNQEGILASLSPPPPGFSSQS